MINKKIKYIILCFLILFTGIIFMGNTKNDDFNLELVLKHDEQSKDCNWNTITISIINNELIYSAEYGGFKAPENFSEKKKINNEQIEKIREYILKNNFNTNINEAKSTKEIGIAGSLKINLIIEGKTTNINISGKTNIWGSDEYVRKKWEKKYVKSRTNIDNIKYIHNAKALISFIKSTCNIKH